MQRDFDLGKMEGSIGSVQAEGMSYSTCYLLRSTNWHSMFVTPVSLGIHSPNAMDVPRSRPSRATWTKNHKHQHSHDYSGQDSKSEKPKFKPHDNTQHFIRMDTPYGNMRENPVTRSREKNDEFVQTWLQQTQARDLHLPRRGQHERLPDTANRSRSRADVSRRGKRPRPQSDDAPPSPKLAGQVEHRFEKRARHKTRSGKYDYKTRPGNKNVTD